MYTISVQASACNLGVLVNGVTVLSQAVRTQISTGRLCAEYLRPEGNELVVYARGFPTTDSGWARVRIDHTANPVPSPSDRVAHINISVTPGEDALKGDTFDARDIPQLELWNASDTLDAISGFDHSTIAAVLTRFRDALARRDADLVMQMIDLKMRDLGDAIGCGVEKISTVYRQSLERADGVTVQLADRARLILSVEGGQRLVWAHSLGGAHALSSTLKGSTTNLPVGLIRTSGTWRICR
jgi:hypothetical protein